MPSVPLKVRGFLGQWWQVVSEVARGMREIQSRKWILALLGDGVGLDMQWPQSVSVGSVRDGKSLQRLPQTFVSIC